MNNGNNYESRLWGLLEEEKLADLSQFHQRGFFDEVPLYSREADIDFLGDGKKTARVCENIAPRGLFRLCSAVWIWP